MKFLSSGELMKCLFKDLFYVGLRKPSKFRCFQNLAFINESRVFSELAEVQFSFISGCRVVLAAAQVQSGSKKGAGSLQFLSLKKMSCPNMNIQEWNSGELQKCF